MIGFGCIKETMAEQAYSIAEVGSRVVLLCDVQGSFEKDKAKKGSVYTLREVDNMGIVYLVDAAGNLFCAPYFKGMFKKEDKSCLAKSQK